MYIVGKSRKESAIQLTVVDLYNNLFFALKQPSRFIGFH